MQLQRGKHCAQCYTDKTHQPVLLIHDAKHTCHAGVVQLAHDERLLVQHGSCCGCYRPRCVTVTDMAQQLHRHLVALHVSVTAHKNAMQPMHACRIAELSKACETVNLTAGTRQKVHARLPRTRHVPFRTLPNPPSPRTRPLPVLMLMSLQ
jgi:hypothetical protein